MTWLFNQTTGEITDPTGTVVAVGYAGGNCGQNPEGKNNPSMQDVKSVGPLPVGVYTFALPVEGSHLGPFAIPLIPDPTNDMHGRGDFFFHGDNVEHPGCASEGCIIGPHAVREAAWAGDDHTITVISGV